MNCTSKFFFVWKLFIFFKCFSEKFTCTNNEWIFRIKHLSSNNWSNKDFKCTLVNQTCPTLNEGSLKSKTPWFLLCKLKTFGKPLFHKALVYPDHRDGYFTRRPRISWPQGRIFYKAPSYILTTGTDILQGSRISWPQGRIFYKALVYPDHRDGYFTRPSYILTTGADILQGPCISWPQGRNFKNWREVAKLPTAGSNPESPVQDAWGFE